jgi:two-component system, response regulator RegA
VGVTTTAGVQYPIACMRGAEASDGTILLVDDNEFLLRSLSRTLRSRGRRVLTAARVADGKQLVEQESPAVVVTDLRLPGESGLELIEWLRARSRDLPVYVFTGVDCPRLAAQCGRLGATDYFLKCRDDEVLMRVLFGPNEPLSVKSESDVLKHVVTSESERRWHVLGVAELCNGNVSEAARLLAVPRPTLQRWLRDYGVAPVIRRET